MNSIPIVLAAAEADLPEAATHGTGEVVVVGFMFVMVVLAVLSAITALLGAFFSKQAAKEAAKSAEALKHAPTRMSVPQSSAALTTAAAPAEEDDPAIIAVITAAVHSVIGDRAHRIVTIRPGGPGWAQEGRRQIFSSHRVR